MRTGRDVVVLRKNWTIYLLERMLSMIVIIIVVIFGIVVVGMNSVCVAILTEVVVLATGTLVAYTTIEREGERIMRRMNNNNKNKNNIRKRE